MKWASWNQPIEKSWRKTYQLRGDRECTVRKDHRSPGGRTVPGIENFPCVIPNWDNTPRSGGNGLVLHRFHARSCSDAICGKPLTGCAMPHANTRIVFVKSWNEWAEGNHLEPDLKFGLRYLEVLREELLEVQALEKQKAARERNSQKPCPQRIPT